MYPRVHLTSGGGGGIRSLSRDSGSVRGERGTLLRTQPSYTLGEQMDSTCLSFFQILGSRSKPLEQVFVCGGGGGYCDIIYVSWLVKSGV